MVVYEVRVDHFARKYTRLFFCCCYFCCCHLSPSSSLDLFGNWPQNVCNVYSEIVLGIGLHSIVYLFEAACIILLLWLFLSLSHTVLCAIDCFKRVSHTRSAHTHIHKQASKQTNKQTNIINHPSKHTLIRLASTNTHIHAHVSKKTSGVIVNDGPSVYFGKPLLSLQCMSFSPYTSSFHSRVCVRMCVFVCTFIVQHTHMHTANECEQSVNNSHTMLYWIRLETFLMPYNQQTNKQTNKQHTNTYYTINVHRSDWTGGISFSRLNKCTRTHTREANKSITKRCRNETIYSPSSNRWRKNVVLFFKYIACTHTS